MNYTGFVDIITEEYTSVSIRAVHSHPIRTGHVSRHQVMCLYLDHFFPPVHELWRSGDVRWEEPEVLRGAFIELEELGSRDELPRGWKKKADMIREWLRRKGWEIDKDTLELVEVTYTRPQLLLQALDEDCVSQSWLNSFPPVYHEWRDDDVDGRDCEELYDAWMELLYLSYRGEAGKGCKQSMGMLLEALHAQDRNIEGCQLVGMSQDRPAPLLIQDRNYLPEPEEILVHGQQQHKVHVHPQPVYQQDTLGQAGPAYPALRTIEQKKSRKKTEKGKIKSRIQASEEAYGSGESDHRQEASTVQDQSQSHHDDSGHSTRKPRQSTMASKSKRRHRSHPSSSSSCLSSSTSSDSDRGHGGTRKTRKTKSKSKTNPRPRNPIHCESDYASDLSAHSPRAQKPLPVPPRQKAITPTPHNPVAGFENDYASASSSDFDFTFGDAEEDGSSQVTIQRQQCC